MSAYATPQQSKETQLLHLDPTATPRAFPLVPDAGDHTVAIDALLDQVADRLAAAVVARLAEAHQPEREDWLDSQEAAEYLGVHRDTLRRLAAARAIPAEQDGRGCKLFFRRAALDEWRRSGGRVRHLSAVAVAA